MTAHTADRRLQWLAALVAVVGLTVSVIWGVTALLDPVQRPQSFLRADLPGSVAVDLNRTGRQLVYYEGDHPENLTAEQIRVVGPDGSTIPTESYDHDLRYDIGDSLGTAVASFDADVAGTYLVGAGVEVAQAEVADPLLPEAGARIAVGQDLVPLFVRAILLPALIALASIVGAVLIATRAVRPEPRTTQTLPGKVSP